MRISDWSSDVCSSDLEAGKLAGGALAPLNEAGDQQGARLENGVVRTPDGFADAYRQFVDGGWNGAPFEEEWGGMGLPWLVATALSEMWQGANLAFGLCPLLPPARSAARCVGHKEGSSCERP